jgi:FdhE protein
MTVDYDRRIARAQELAAAYPESADLLNFYCGLARIQSDIFDVLRKSDKLRSSNETDPRALARYFPSLLEFVERHAPEHLADFARTLLAGPRDARENILTGYWEGDRTTPQEAQFLARLLLQPFAESLAERSARPFVGQSRDEPSGSIALCPFCSAKPVLAVLRGEGDGGKRSLICSLCSTEWEYRRIVCPNCGEENRDQLPIYIAEQTGYVRVDACDTCKSYLKSVDFTKNGHAVPIVDELATVALNIWAEEHGYVKLETNVLGM